MVLFITNILSINRLYLYLKQYQLTFKIYVYLEQVIIIIGFYYNFVLITCTIFYTVYCTVYCVHCIMYIPSNTDYITLNSVISFNEYSSKKTITILYTCFLLTIYDIIHAVTLCEFVHINTSMYYGNQLINSIYEM